MLQSKDADTALTRRIDTVLVAVERSWPVGVYSLDSNGGLIRRVDGPVASRHRNPRHVDAPIDGLRKADDGAILAWVSRNGFIGVARPPRPGELHTQREEWLEDIRHAVRQLLACQRLLAAVRAGESSHRLHWRRRALGGPEWTHDQQHDRAVAYGVGLDGIIDEPPRRTLPADFGALAEVAWAVSFWVRTTTTVRAELRATRYTIRADPEIVAQGPIGLAFLELFEELARFPINRGKTGSRLIWRDRLVTCPVCRRQFRRNREDQRFDTKRCRWTANQREKREREQHEREERA